MTFPTTYPERYASEIKERIPIEDWPLSVRYASARIASSLNVPSKDGCPRSLLASLDDDEINRYIPHASDWIHGKISDETFAAISDGFVSRRKFALLYAESVLRNDGDFPSREAEKHIVATLTGAKSIDALAQDLTQLWAA